MKPGRAHNKLDGILHAGPERAFLTEPACKEANTQAVPDAWRTGNRIAAVTPAFRRRFMTMPVCWETNTDGMPGSGVLASLSMITSGSYASSYTIAAVAPAA